MDYRIQVITLSVSDVDKAAAFYTQQAGFTLDVDYHPASDFRVVQLTPPGSACSVTIGKGLGAGEPGSLKGLQLVVSDVAAARAELVGRGVDVTPVRHVDESSGEWSDGPGGPWNSFIFFDDPDGNSWTVQEKPVDA